MPNDHSSPFSKNGGLYYRDDSECSEDDAQQQDRKPGLDPRTSKESMPLAAGPSTTGFTDEWKEDGGPADPIRFSSVLFSKYEPRPGRPEETPAGFGGLYMEDSLTELRAQDTAAYKERAEAQSEHPRAALKNLDVDDYLRPPKAARPSAYPPRPAPNKVLDDRPKDVFFRRLYTGSVAAMLLAGLLTCLVVPSDVRDGILRSPTAYRVIMASAKAYFSVITFSIVVAMAWTMLLQQFAEPIVYGMVGFIPASCLVACMWATREFFHNDPSSAYEHAYLYLVAAASFVGALGSAVLIYRHRSTVATTVRLTRTASAVLQENPAVYFATLMILLAYLCFVAVWTVMFAHLLLLGHVQTVEAPELAKHFQLSSWSYLLQAYFLFMLGWTTAVFSNVQKAMIAGVVSKWYFAQGSPRPAADGPDPVVDSLRLAVDRFAGQVCFGALILSLVRAMRISFMLYRKGAAQVHARWARPVLGTIGATLAFCEKLVEHVTDFAIYNVALTGESLCTSGRSVTRIFKRNTLLGLTTDAVARLIFSCTIILVATLTGLGSYGFASHVLKSEYGWVAGMLFGVLSWHILQIFAEIYSATMDVAFLCYAIDVDTERVHSASIHLTFASQEACQQNSLF